MTIRKLMRKKLQEIKQQLRKRMHDHAPQTGRWLRSVVQGYFNYYTVPTVRPSIASRGGCTVRNRRGFSTEIPLI
jgi:hypothetical protein